MATTATRADRQRARRVIAAAVAALTILCLLALVILVAREQVTSSVIAVEGTRGDTQGERAALETLLRQDPHDVAALAELAELARDERRFVDAAEAWAKIAKLDPLHATARFEQARNLIAAGDAAAAVEALTADAREPQGAERVLLARALLMQGRLEEVRAQADAALAADGGSAAAMLAADLAFIDGDDAAAEAGYRALRADPEHADAAALGLAQVALRRGDTDAARAALAEIGPAAGFQMLRARAALYRQLGDNALAAADLDALIARYGPIPDAVVPLAELRAATDDAAGVAALRRALTGTDTAALAARHYLQAIEAYLGDDPETARDYLAWSADWLGGRDLHRWMQLEVGAKLGDVMLAGESAASMARGSVGPERRARAAAVLAAQAAVQADAGAADTAQTLARLALELRPELPAAQLVLARAALLDGDAAAARELAAPLLADETHRAAALEVQGRAALAEDDSPTAAARFRELAEALPDAAVGPYWQGVAAVAGGDLGAAESWLRTAYARRADPRIEAALLDVLIRRSDFAAAEALAREVGALPAPTDRARGLAWLGTALSAQGRGAEAAVAYRDAAAADPARAAYALAAADALLELKDFDAARALLDTAAARHPDNRYVAFKGAYAAQLAGDAADAVRRYRALLGRTPDWALPMLNLSELLAADEATRAEGLALAERAAELAPNWVAARWSLAELSAAAGADAAALAAAEQVLKLAPEHAGAGALIARLRPAAQR